ncbi:MAG: prepilin-type N-terminal cleavage/methylation domain-containing protein [Firmicutes bacterium]|nr:prepilin-type N-terminal cleavage/methylation domain-containing protein [Bacillota bacterium]
MKKQLNGFTLIELMVALTILMIIASIGFYFYRKDQARSTCQTAAQILAINLKYARSQALAYEVPAGITAYQNHYTIWIGNSSYIANNCPPTLPCSGMNCYTCRPSQPCFPNCTDQIKNVNLSGLVPVSIVSAPPSPPNNGPCTAFPCYFMWLPVSTSLNGSGGFIWGHGTPYFSGSFVLKSGNVQHQVTVSANGQIQVQ